MVFHDLPEGAASFSRTVVTIGNFDGVHLGHRAILARVHQRAKELEAQSVAVTFDPHPLKVLRPEASLPLLTTPEQKISLMAASGLDAVVVLPFTREFAGLPAREFVQRYFLERLKVREVVVGHDYCFGRGREGNIDLLKEMGKQHGFTVQVVWAVEADGAVVSSSLIRAMLRLGKVEEAGRLLGRPYGVAGRVVAGKGRGAKLLGIPTANIRPENELLPATGIYAVRVRRGDEILPGAANIGTCPTFENGEFSLEVHLLDFSGDLYGENLGVEFVARLREERRFPSIEDLAAQIHADIAAAREVLARE
ncbi:MAG: bifunctional riboflavin kinase/FAD synthetase [Deltaproteobacteria bacterium]|nr:bifunctional riboflavin kinase/FAD synthetase [Deltaproteobacteria bacterium]